MAQTKEYRRAYYLANKVQILAKNAEYKEANYELTKERNALYRSSNVPKQKERAAKYYLENKEKVTEQTNRRRLALAGWTPEMYEERFVEQEGKCEICGDTVAGKLCCDHIHTAPPIPRGLLCSNCNSAIGMLQEQEKRFLAAIAYLKKYETQMTQGEKDSCPNQLLTSQA